MTVEFTIDGLNAKQRMLADIIWKLDTKERVDAFIQSLPKKERVQAEIIVQLMILAVVEQCYDGINQEMPEAKSLIDKCRK